MTGYIQAQISAEDLIETMLQDQGFAEEVWRELNDACHRGLLLDEAMDIIKGAFSTREKKVWIGNLRLMADVIEQDLECMPEDDQ